MDNYNKRVCVLNEFDKIIGTDNALKAHTRTSSKLHRAYSLFLFAKSKENNEIQLLMQKRAPSKLVFPNRWTNTICSHPFINELSFNDPILDCKRQLLKRLECELGISNSKLSSESLIFYDRMMYMSFEKYNKLYGFLGKNVEQQEIDNELLDSAASSSLDTVLEPLKFKDTDFQEFEIDYIFFAYLNDFELNLNPDEACDARLMSQKELENLMKKESFSPWFEMIYSNIKIFQVFEKHLQKNNAEIVI
ncbi:isopentenyl-diphosphate delta-isomerase [Edhazardia aedis USNM 41457]|uniref:isopentenyl-diphosphate Delta-isomerase n=1 Tax=Edhazardia aedis (strain USNM 41457) TaxID=1003232 RepID=J9DP18_EDHAE|nr:isopentenyl-diphosphate delta-isomerase [Edhazardia aedis USNM 41457]|eukprot:EJW03087.1 isopentenyl-diphosphate delta-isomerase [Edhazardia aedis USNM 41457]